MLTLPTLLPLLHFWYFQASGISNGDTENHYKSNTNQPNKSGHGAFVVNAVNLEHSGHICACTDKMTGDLGSLAVLRTSRVFAMHQIYLHALASEEMFLKYSEAPSTRWLCCMCTARSTYLYFCLGFPRLKHGDLMHIPVLQDADEITGSHSYMLKVGIICWLPHTLNS